MSCDTCCKRGAFSADTKNVDARVVRSLITALPRHCSLRTLLVSKLRLAKSRLKHGQTRKVHTYIHTSRIKYSQVLRLIKHALEFSILDQFPAIHFVITLLFSLAVHIWRTVNCPKPLSLMSNFIVIFVVTIIRSWNPGLRSVLERKVSTGRRRIEGRATLCCTNSIGK